MQSGLSGEGGRLFQGKKTACTRGLRREGELLTSRALVMPHVAGTLSGGI